MSDPKIEPTRAFHPADVPETAIPKSEAIRIRAAGADIRNTVVSRERSGIVTTTADAAKPIEGAKAPPLSAKPVLTTPLAQRLRERLKKGG